MPDATQQMATVPAILVSEVDVLDQKPVLGALSAQMQSAMPPGTSGSQALAQGQGQQHSPAMRSSNTPNMSAGACGVPVSVYVSSANPLPNAPGLPGAPGAGGLLLFSPMQSRAQSSGAQEESLQGGVQGGAFGLHAMQQAMQQQQLQEQFQLQQQSAAAAAAGSVGPPGLPSEAALKQAQRASMMQMNNTMGFVAAGGGGMPGFGLETGAGAAAGGHASSHMSGLGGPMSGGGGIGGGAGVGPSRPRVALTPEEKRQRFLERNRAAAARCRLKRKKYMETLQHNMEFFTEESKRQKILIVKLQAQMVELRKLFFEHSGCPVFHQQTQRGQLAALMKLEAESVAATNALNQVRASASAAAAAAAAAACGDPSAMSPLGGPGGGMSSRSDDINRTTPALSQSSMDDEDDQSTAFGTSLAPAGLAALGVQGISGPGQTQAPGSCSSALNSRTQTPLEMSCAGAGMGVGAGGCLNASGGLNSSLALNPASLGPTLAQQQLSTLQSLQSFPALQSLQSLQQFQSSGMQLLSLVHYPHLN